MCTVSLEAGLPGETLMGAPEKKAMSDRVDCTLKVPFYLPGTSWPFVEWKVLNSAPLAIWTVNFMMKLERSRKHCR